MPPSAPVSPSTASVSPSPDCAPMGSPPTSPRRRSSAHRKSAVQGNNVDLGVSGVKTCALPIYAPHGASIAVNGVCLTVTGLRPDGFPADLAPETLERSNLGDLRAGSRVNLERPLSPGGRMNGHIVQGHVDGTGEFLSLDSLGEDNWWLRIRIPDELDPYLVYKGSIAIDGISLTVDGD